MAPRSRTADHRQSVRVADPKPGKQPGDLLVNLVVILNKVHEPISKQRHYTLQGADNRLPGMIPVIDHNIQPIIAKNALLPLPLAVGQLVKLVHLRFNLAKRTQRLQIFPVGGKVARLNVQKIEGSTEG